MLKYRLTTQGETLTTRTKTIALSGVLAGALLLTGCAGDSSPEGADQPAPPAASEPAPEPGAEDAPVVQEATCDWGSPRLAPDDASAPNSTTGELTTAIIGAWQHTPSDTGSG